MLTENEIRFIRDNLLGFPPFKELGKWMFYDKEEMFILHECTFTIFNSKGELDFTLENSSPGNPYIFVNRQSLYYPVSWPKNWKMIEMGWSYSEIVYQRTQF